MAIFGRKRAVQAAGGQRIQGRHLHSDEDQATCVDNFLTLHGLTREDAFQPSWAGDEAKSPTAVLGIRQPAGSVYLAIWANGGYQERFGYQEMGLILPAFDPDEVIPIPGRWKQLDPSLKSIGYTSGFSIRS